MLRRKRPASISGRQVYVSDVMTKAKAPTQFATEKAKAHARRKVFATHARHWAELSAAEKLAYDRRARALQGQKAQDLEQRRGTLEAEVAAKRSTLRRNQADAADSMVLSQCTLTNAELARLTDLAESAPFSGGRGEALHTQALRCPAPLSQVAFKEHQVRGELAGPAVHQLCATTRHLAYFRETFQEAVLLINVDTADEAHYRFIFASQQPFGSGLASS